MLKYFIILSILFLFACGEIKRDPNAGKSREEIEREELGNFFGDDITLFGGNRDENTGQGSGIGVNAFLWRASLDTISFFPLSSADPFGGLILSDWYSPANENNIRYKVTIYIFGRELRSDGLRVSVFKEAKDASGNWTTVNISQDMATKLEDAILTRARELRVKSRNLENN